jgi:hypothetical protein
MLVRKVTNAEVDTQTDKADGCHADPDGQKQTDHDQEEDDTDRKADEAHEDDQADQDAYGHREIKKDVCHLHRAAP